MPEMPKPAGDGNLNPNLGDPSSGAQEIALSEMQAMLQRQRQVIEQLRSQVATLQGEIIPGEMPPTPRTEDNNQPESQPVELDVSPNTEGTKRRTIVEVLEEHEKVHTAFYTFEQSMWDAALLLCFHHTSFTDKILLGIGVILNLSLQTLLLVTIFADMLDNPFNDDTVAEMVRWRVTQGHSTFDADQGKSLINRLCNRELWSFEQEAYNEMYDYLYKPVPGVLLSTLAIILWVLTIMVEYRRCLEQGLAVYQLPRLTSDDEFETIDDDGNIEIAGIQPCLRWVAIIVLCTPRLFVMAFLAYVGCQYLARTPSLSDIVLNAVALAFVLDVDELVANVLLTEKLRGLLPKIQPLSCGTTRAKFTPFKDLLRYAITIGMIVFAVTQWLLPFSWNVEAAAMALCGGYMDFSYTGGIQTDQSIILRPREFGTDKWVTDCEESSAVGSTNFDFYVGKYYGLGERNSSRASSASNTTTRSADYWSNLAISEVMGFAFAAIPTGTTCPVGEILEPEREGEDTRRCIPIPASLKARLPDGVQAGRTTWPQNCPRFDVTLGCMPVVLPQSCVWTWLSQTCDGRDDGTGPPGQIYYDACTANSPLIQCQTWDMFGKTHPSYNCEATEKCPEDLYPEFNCISMTGNLDLQVSSLEDITSNSELFLNGLKQGIIQVAQVDDYNLELTDNLGILNQQTPGYGGWRRLASEQFVVNYQIKSLPVTVFPNVVLGSTDTIINAANFIFQNSTNSSNATNATTPFSILSMEFVNNTVATLDELTPSSPDGGDSGDGPYDGPGGHDGGFDGGFDSGGGHGYGSDGGGGFDGGFDSGGGGNDGDIDGGGDDGDDE